VIRENEFDVLLFDLGGVLMNFAGFEELAGLLPGSPHRSEVRDRWIRSKSVQLFERGEITPQQFADGVIEEFRLDLTPKEFLTNFVEWAHGPYSGAISLLTSLRNDFRIAALSNSNELHTPLHRRRFEGAVDTFFFSDEIGLVKPDREIFDFVIRDLAVSPRRIAFFDDTPVNIEAAREVGLTAYLVDGIVAVKNQLQLLDLLDSPFD
jgi:HAD superfamily hydrolase (TIGR01509 family)